MIVHSARFVTSAAKRQEYPKDRWPQVAFAGRSNVGKSSLLNSLVRERRLAKISRTPGRTQRLNFFVINDCLHFVDLPGYGYAKVPEAVRKQWRPMIETFLRHNPQLKTVIVILDARRQPSELDRSLLAFLSSEGVPILPVVTKIDKLSGNQRGKALADLGKALAPYGTEPPLPFSSKSGEGREALLAKIDEAVHP